MTTPLPHTDPAQVSEVKITEDTPRNPYAMGYGPKVPTSFMLRYAGRWHRVYVMQYGNSGTAYIVSRGQDLILDIDTEYRLIDAITSSQAFTDLVDNGN